MAREHLYKAKRKDNGEWVYGNLLGKETIVPKGQEFYVLGAGSAKIFDLEDCENDFFVFDVVAETVCEYTGLEDKTGTKIFEGDIVSFGIDLLLGEFIYPIEWKKDRVGFGYGGKADRMLEIDGEHCEVIGNKFDNPELLEVQDD